MNVYYFLLDTYYSIESSPLEIKIVIRFVLVNLFLLIFSFVVIFRIQRLAIRRQKIMEEVRPKLYDLLSHYTLGSTSATRNLKVERNKEELTKEFESILRGYRKKYHTIVRQVSTEVLMDINRLEANINKDNFHQVQLILTLHSTKNQRSFKRASALAVRELNISNELDRGNYEAMASQMIFSKVRAVRMAAYLYLLYVGGTNAYAIFEDPNINLTLWERLQLTDMLIRVQAMGRTPNYRRYILRCTNESMLIYIIRAAAYFQDHSIKDLIMSYLDEKGERVRIECYTALGTLRAVEQQDFLIQRYYEEGVDCQLAILKSIGEMRAADTDIYDFLIRELIETFDLRIEKVIIDTIEKLNPTDRERNRYRRLIVEATEGIKNFRLQESSTSFVHLKS